MLTLYYSKGSVALAPHIVLEETGATYATERIDFAKDEQKDARYLAVNPKARVPALVTDRGILTEAAAIMLFVAQTYPDAGLAPTDPHELAVAQGFNLYLAATVHVAHAHGGRAARWADDAEAQVHMRAKVSENMAACADLIMTHYLKGPWVLGEQYSMCDAYLFTMCRWFGSDGVDLRAFPAIERHFAAVEARPAVQRVLALHA